MGSPQNEGLQPPRSSLSGAEPTRPELTVQDQNALGSGPSGSGELRTPLAKLPNPTAETPDEIKAALASIASEQLPRRQLRHAARIAQVHGIKFTSELDAVRQLREAGINLFAPASSVRNVSSGGDARPSATSAAPPREVGKKMLRLPGDNSRLPKRAKLVASRSPNHPVEVRHAAEILRMRKDIVLRRRIRLVLLWARMFAFVLVPTMLAGWYFYVVATPMYSVRSEFVLLETGSSSSSTTLGGLFSGTNYGNSQYSTAVEGYLKSREVMERLDDASGFRSHFQNPNIDPLQRLSLNATLETTYKFYKRFVLIDYDEIDQIIRMEVIATDPAVAAEWSRQLVKYAEDQVDKLTQRLREDQIRDAQASYDAAQEALETSQLKLLSLQREFKIISSELEVGLVLGQINELEKQLIEERVSLRQMATNSEPNESRMELSKRRIATLEDEVAALRTRLSESSDKASSLAQIQSMLFEAEADMQTRQMLRLKALQSMETARTEAKSQVRYLSLSVSPIPTDEPSYPRALENTLGTMMILLGIYLTLSTAVNIWREKVS